MTEDLGEIFEGVFDNTVSKLGSSISNPVSSGKKSSYSQFYVKRGKSQNIPANGEIQNVPVKSKTQSGLRLRNSAQFSK